MTRRAQPLHPFQLLHHRYRVETVLAQGAFGDIYCAQDTLLDLPVILKTARATENPFDAAEMLREEARCLAQIHHSSIPGYVDFFYEKQRWVLVMQHIEGACLRTDKPLSVAQVAQIGRELCDILIYLHGKALVHQNIQPAHILAADTQLFLIDFGLSCQTGARAFGMSDSVFTAPEQRSGGVATDRVDIYALGQTLRVLLTGAPAVASIPAPAFAVYPLSSVRGYDALLACCGAMTDPSPEARPDAWNAWSMLNEVCREIPARFAV